MTSLLLIWLCWVNRDENLLLYQILWWLEFLKLATSRMASISRPLLGTTPAMFGATLCVLDLLCVGVLDGV